MQRGGGGRRDDFFDFDDPFGGFGGGFGGFGNPRSLMSSFLGGRDPFDDPFFSRPFGSMFGSSMFGPSMFAPRPGFFEESPMGPTGFLHNRPAPVAASNSTATRGPVIEEINSDDDDEEEGKVKEAAEQTQDNPRKHARSAKAPFVEDPDDDVEERRIRHMQNRNDYARAQRTQPQTRSFSFQSSSVTYGGVNGAYYTSSTSRRMGSDGVMVEESKEADTTTGKATHKVSRGLLGKGHTLTRKLNSDGKVDERQTLHNLNEDELAGFDEAWKGRARMHLPPGFEGISAQGSAAPSSSNGQHPQATRGGWALPSTEQPPHIPSQRYKSSK